MEELVVAIYFHGLSFSETHQRPRWNLTWPIKKKMPIFLREKNSFGQQLIVYNFLGKNVDFLQMQLPITFSHQIQLTAISRKKITSFLGLAFSRLAILAFFSKILVVCHNPMLSQPLCWRCELIWPLEGLMAQCENWTIFLLLRIYVKWILEPLRLHQPLRKFTFIL